MTKDKEKKTILYGEPNKDMRKIIEDTSEQIFSDYNLEIHEDGNSLGKRLDKTVNGVHAVVLCEELEGFRGIYLLDNLQKILNLKKFLLF